MDQIICQALSDARRINPLLAEVFQLFANAEHDSFIVGGWSRDILCGAISDDLDIVYNADPITIADRLTKIPILYQALTSAEENKHFHSVRLRLKPSAQQHIKEICIIPLNPDKSENANVDELISADLWKRDFRANAIAIKFGVAVECVIIDPFGGWSDIRERHLTPLRESLFWDEPLTILRGCRTVSRGLLRFNEHTRSLIEAASHENVIDAAPRAHALHAFMKLFGEMNIPPLFKLLAELKVFSGPFPDLDFQTLSASNVVSLRGRPSLSGLDLATQKRLRVCAAFFEQGLGRFKEVLAYFQLDDDELSCWMVAWEFFSAIRHDQDNA